LSARAQGPVKAFSVLYHLVFQGKEGELYAWVWLGDSLLYGGKNSYTPNKVSLPIPPTHQVVFVALASQETTQPLLKGEISGNLGRNIETIRQSTYLRPLHLSVFSNEFQNFCGLNHRDPSDNLPAWVYCFDSFEQRALSFPKLR
jgi:hypothetical protein